MMKLSVLAVILTCLNPTVQAQELPPTEDPKPVEIPVPTPTPTPVPEPIFACTSPAVQDAVNVMMIDANERLISRSVRNHFGMKFKPFLKIETVAANHNQAIHYSLVAAGGGKMNLHLNLIGMTADLDLGVVPLRPEHYPTCKKFDPGAYSEVYQWVMGQLK